MGLALLTLCLLCTPPAHAQGGYPGGGSGYPGGGSGSGYPGDGSGGGTPPDPGHYWKITYSSSGHITYAIPDTPIQGQSTPQSDPWDSTSSGGGLESETNINGDVLCKVTATLTWIPAAGQAPHSDPPPKKVFINETGIAEESPSIWGAPFDDPFDGPTPGGSADDGLGDSPVPFNYGYSSSGTHLERISKCRPKNGLAVNR